MGTTRRIARGPAGAAKPPARSDESAAWNYEIQAPLWPIRRYDASRWFMRVAVGAFARVRVEGRSNLPFGPYVLCFTHQSWTDPLFVMGFLPGRPQMFFFGPQEEEMRVGARNRLMRWAGIAIPYKPGRRGLLAATARARAILAAGRTIALAGEGRIHAGERVVLPIEPGAAYLALRAGVPIVPVAINGNGWLKFRAVVRLRIGAPIYGEPLASPRPKPDEVGRLADKVGVAFRWMVADAHERPKPGALESRLTELFNDWPEGERPDVPPDGAGAEDGR
jgi:1-acyl-sn-glycerol-3-phosphate acyltransferase